MKLELDLTELHFMRREVRLLYEKSFFEAQKLDQEDWSDDAISLRTRCKTLRDIADRLEDMRLSVEREAKS